MSGLESVVWGPGVWRGGGVRWGGLEGGVAWGGGWDGMGWRVGFVCGVNDLEGGV